MQYVILITERAGKVLNPPRICTYNSPYNSPPYKTIEAAHTAAGGLRERNPENVYEVNSLIER